MKYLNHSEDNKLSGHRYIAAPDCTHLVTDSTKQLLTRVYQLKVANYIKRGLTIKPVETLKSSFQDVRAKFMAQNMIDIFLAGTKGTLGVDTILERTYHELIHIEENQGFTVNNEYCVAIATMIEMRIQGNLLGYDDNTIYQSQQVVWSDVYLQACSVGVLGSFIPQKVVLTSVPKV